MRRRRRFWSSVAAVVLVVPALVDAVATLLMLWQTCFFFLSLSPPPVDFESKINNLITRVAWSIGIDVGDRLRSGAKKVKFVVNGPLPGEWGRGGGGRGRGGRCKHKNKSLFFSLKFICEISLCASPHILLPTQEGFLKEGQGTYVQQYIRPVRSLEMDN